ncbi:protein GOS9 [Lactuca sativa]|uniref:Jacalin-type lectin domain-containing protein n=1 Tax=Lactuca sativa TaxID=4236 RepID=A0A9R1X210_LACSA|nr:protein GOS9 [Lactuca sativa]KAJ0195444.1 hypothetical protein LSAT_V11C700355310 [Lactuca sativa]
METGSKDTKVLTLAYQISMCLAANAECVWGTPWGGKGGSRTWEFIIPDGSTLTKIDLSSGDALDFISFTYKDGSSSMTMSISSGLVGISGRVGLFGDNTVITSVTFWTNIGTYGEYGTNPRTDFSFGVTLGKFSGFYGKCGNSVDSLGVILQA